MSNTANYLKTAGDLIKGDLANINEELKKGREAKNGVLWEVLANLLVYANTKVFAGGYTKKLAKQFKMDVCAETGLSEKQAGKYTESISAGLGVRGIRKGLKTIEGLTAACDDVKTVKAFLNAAEITTFNKFIAATRVDLTPVQTAAKVLAKLTPAQRNSAVEMAEKMDKDSEDTDE